jgi:hypothetical protein
MRERPVRSRLSKWPRPPLSEGRGLLLTLCGKELNLE